MKPRKHPGTCLLCRETVGKKGAERHLEGCLASTGWPEGLSPSYIIRIDGRRDPSFWMFVLARCDAMFSDLDSLVTDVWMGEEDGSSTFTIQGTTYIDAETKKQVPLADRIREGQIFYYTYDAHSPEKVELKCKVVGMTSVMPPAGPCCLIARNIPDLPPCYMCGDKAEFLAAESDAFDPFDEMDGGHYYCHDCLMDLDSAIITPVVNSPCPGASFNMDDYDGVRAWYPPGWDMDDLVSEDIQEILGMAIEMPDEHVSLRDIFGDDDPTVIMEQMAREDVGDEIDGFLIEEKELGKDVNLSEEIVRSFCTTMCGIHEVSIDDWDAALLECTLLEDVALNPHATTEWAEQFIPVLCRFLEYAETAGRDVDTGEIFPALLEAEPEFLRRIAAQRHWRISTDGVEDAGLSGVDFGGRDGVTDLLISAMADTIEKTDGIGESLKFRKFLEDLLDEDPGMMEKIYARNVSVSDKYEDFCARMDDEWIDKRCVDIMRVLVSQPDKPLMRGSAELWSGAIVFVACEEAGRIDEVEEQSPMVEDICDYFRLTPSSLQSCVLKVKAYLADPDLQDWKKLQRD